MGVWRSKPKNSTPTCLSKSEKDLVAFIIEVIDQQFSKEVIHILKSNHFIKLNDLEFLTLERAKEWGIKDIDAEKIINEFKRRKKTKPKQEVDYPDIKLAVSKYLDFKSTDEFISVILDPEIVKDISDLLHKKNIYNLQTLNSLPFNELLKLGIKSSDACKIRKELDNIKTAYIAKLSNPINEEKMPKKPPQTYPHEMDEIKMEYVLKTDSILPYVGENLLPKSDMYFESHIDNEVYIIFKSMKAREQFEIENSLKKENSIKPLKKGALLRLYLRKEIIDFLSDKWSNLKKICEEYDAYKVLGTESDGKDHLIFYTTDENSGQLFKDLQKKFFNLSLREFTYKNNYIEKKFKSLFHKLLCKSVQRIEILYDFMIKCSYEEEFWNFKILGKGDHNIVRSQICESKVYSECRKIKIPILDEIEYDLNSEENEECSDIDFNKEYKQTLRRSKRAHYEIEKMQQINVEVISNEIEKICTDLESKYEIILYTKLKEALEKEKASYKIKIFVIGFDKTLVKRSLNEFINELNFEEKIDFNSGDENPLKGALIACKQKELNQYARKKGVYIFVNYDKECRKSYIILKGRRKSVMSICNHINTILENFYVYQININFQYPVLKKSDASAEKEYRNALIIYCKRILTNYKKEKFEKNAFEFEISLSPNCELIINVKIGTSEIIVSEKIKEEILKALESLTIKIIDNFNTLISKMSDGSFSQKAFCEKYKVKLIIYGSDAVVIGRKENVEATVKSLYENLIVLEEFALRDKHRSLIKKLMSEKLKQIEKDCNTKISIGINSYVLSVTGKKNQVQLAINELRRVEKSIIDSLLIETVIRTEEDLEMLRNCGKLTTYSENNSVEFVISDSGVCIERANAIISTNNINIIIKEGNILDNQSVEVIVNSANSRLAHASGVAYAIANAAGPHFIKESLKYAAEHKLKVGNVAVTSAGILKFKYVFHAIVPIWTENMPNCRSELKNTVKAVLIKANELDIRTLSMPCFCSGCYGFPQSVSAAIILDEILHFSNNKTIKEIHLVDIDSVAIKEFTALLSNPENIKIDTTYYNKVDSTWTPEYQWQWNHIEKADEVYQDYDPDQNWQIEIAYKNKDVRNIKEVEILGDLNRAKNGKKYKVVFDKMLQENVVSGFKRKVRRVPIKKDEKEVKSDATALPPIEERKSQIIIRSSTKVIDEAYTDAKKSVCTIIGTSSSELKKAKAFIVDLCESNKKSKTLKPPAKLSKDDVTKLKQILGNCKCEVEFDVMSQIFIIRGYSDALIESTDAFSQFFIHTKKMDFPPPPTWVTQDNVLMLVNITPDMDEFNTISTNLKKTMPTANIMKLERIQNSRLWNIYSFELKQLEEIHGKVPTQLELYHGTTSHNPSEIYSGEEEGFDMRMSREGMWGIGIYFAVNALYSHGYAYHNSETLQMLIADVIVGDAYETNSNSSLRMPPYKKGKIRHDSVTGQTGGSKVYIIYSNSRAYPKYLITYKL